MARTHAVPVLLGSLITPLFRLIRVFRAINGQNTFRFSPSVGHVRYSTRAEHR